MKTKFSSLVKIKHSKMQESELELQKANARLKKAKKELQKSTSDLNQLQTPTNGNMQEFLAQRTLQEAQQRLIQKNEQWVEFETKEVEYARQQFQKDMIEYEKFKYLEDEEIKKILKKLAIEESKQLDEVAIMTYKQKEAI
jgi:flagellar biosynthesis chaperone FliJ